MKSKILTLISILLINATIGGWSVNEILSWFEKDIPFMADAILGLIAGSISIPVAIVGWILRICGVF